MIWGDQTVIIFRLAAACAAAVLAVTLVGCGVPSAAAPSAVTSATPIPETGSPTPAPVAFLSVIDGDTIETTEGLVRIIGIDAPEAGQCGQDSAAAAIAAVLVAGDPVTLELPAGQNDTDQYGRLIRYVTTPTGSDLGLLQLQAGNAAARYDSTDGYPAHPREAEYRVAQLATLAPDGTVITPACQAAAAPAPPPPAVDRWWEQYSSCTKLKDNTAGHPTGPFSRDDPAQAEIYDWFANRTGNNGDGEGDGLACE